ncbi:MAG: TRAP transporter permease [Rhodospirillales bacterium]|nr:TRAP transporter permease [Rhodospirillales bacterium]MDP6643209.1 TRAP transporter permease [Rhodospirillales bacterium]
MAEAIADTAPPSPKDLQRQIEEIEHAGRHHGPRLGRLIGLIAFAWSLFQLWIASPLPSALLIVDVQKRGIHLAFGLLLCFLIYPLTRSRADRRMPVYDIVFLVLGTGSALYLFLGYRGLVERDGILLKSALSFLGIDFVLPVEAILGGIGILLLLEATRRAIGLPLVVVASVFLVYSIFGQVMPEIISHKGLSLTRLIGYQWLGGEAIFGIPIDVSVSFVFLFVLFGALLETAGAGKYFLDLSFALVGRYRGGPAKAAILASGMTGLISGSSIANVVTTGVFTIPVMRRTGLPAIKAGAIEVAASTNGQIMPPIMGAAAFIIAELIGISYFEVIVAAFIPAVISYLALIYISHLEAMKLGLLGLPRSDIPMLGRTFISGIHFLIPLAVLVYLLMVERWSAGTAVFWSILLLMAIIVAQHVLKSFGTERKGAVQAAAEGFREIYTGMVAGARNMIAIAIAVASAGIIVGSVSSTGLGNALVGIIEVVSGGNIFVLLILTAVLALILGMGLPTTANYLVVATLLAGVLVELGSAAGLVLPLIAVHLFVFYFGILADDTPPVCLAAFAAAAISRADPIKTGIQGFAYDIRTAILPFVFIFNPELLLIGVTSIWHGIMIFVVALIAMFCFASATQGWFIIRTKFYEVILLLIVTFALFRPDVFMNLAFPKFIPVEITKFAAGEVEIEPGRNLRIHAVRETDYGPRFKLYVLQRADGPAVAGQKEYGLTLLATDNGRSEVSNLAAGGIAKKTGIRFGDVVTDVDVENPGQPPKEFVYPFALALLGLIIGSQWLRRSPQVTPRRNTTE